MLPRWRAKRDSMSLWSSTISRRRSASTWFGVYACTSRSSWRATSGSRSALRPGGPELGERVRVGERVGEREVGLGAALLGLVARVDVRVPPRGVRGGLQRLEPLAAVGDELRLGRHLNQMRW